MPVEASVRVLIATICCVFALDAEKPPLGPVTSEDEHLVLTASALIDKEAVSKVLGQDPGMDLVVVDVKLAPRADTKLVVSLDDFTLISRKDGQRSQPLAPSQIAGRGALVVAEGGRGGGIGIMNPGRGPIWGGVPGTGGRPRRAGGDDDGVVASGPASENQSAVKNEGDQGKANPLLDALKERSLPQRETSDTLSGLLYFFLEGKHKLKDLELMYKSPAGRMMLDFQK
jgi:hypothetical protein